MMKKLFLVILSLGLTCVLAQAQGASKITASGRVVDSAGKPVSGAVVSLYRMEYKPGAARMSMPFIDKMTTAPDGKYSLSAAPADHGQGFRTGLVVAAKEGLAFGWEEWPLDQNHEAAITLGKPGLFAGTVVDEAGKPVPGAEVRAYIMLGQFPGRKRLMGLDGFKALTAATDSQGRFAFPALPADARAEFWAEAPGRAKVFTLQPRRAGTQGFQFASGTKDIRIVLPPEARIEGVAVEKSTGKPVPGVLLMLMPENTFSMTSAAPAMTDRQGRFTFSNLIAGPYQVKIDERMERTAEWVSIPAKVTAETGKTVAHVRLELSKGGILEVMVRSSLDKKPVEGASVSFHPVGETRYWRGVVTGKDGVARVRLSPETYQVETVIRYTSKSAPGSVVVVPTERTQVGQAVRIEDGRTRRIEVMLAPAPTIKGVIRDPAGKPVAGAKVSLFGNWDEPAITDAAGNFRITKQEERGMGPMASNPCLIVRQIDRNLAVVVPVEDDTKPLDVKLLPAATVMGRITDKKGTPLPGVRINLNLRLQRYGMPLERSPIITDAKGRYEIKAVPAEQLYSLYTSAEKYGEAHVEVNLDDPQKRVVEIQPMALATADVPLAGIVVDAGGKAIADAQVYISGENQPSLSLQTDAAGKFSAMVCKGSVRLSAGSQDRNQWGQAEVQGGDQAVRIVVEDQSARQAGGLRPAMAPSLIGQPLPDLGAFKIDVNSPGIKAKKLLVCFFDMNGRPSRHVVKKLAALAGDLQKKNAAVVLVQAAPADEKALTDWLIKLGASFPVGRAADEVRALSAQWGVQTVPWLILTDSRHVIQAAGPGVDEIIPKIEAVK
jgi:protocatechuate 3,4-dioxygenase beta subunit